VGFGAIGYNLLKLRLKEPKTMKFTAYLSILVMFLGLFVSGCGQALVPAPVDRPVCLGVSDSETVMVACAEVLEGIGFTIEKYDVEAGYIKTRPLRGGQFFEFWRRDNVGRKNSNEANIHSLRRVVDVELSQEGEKICVNCVAKVTRLGIVSEKDSLSMSQLPEMITGSSSSIQRLDPATDQIYWVDTGTDTMLEDELLRQIAQSISIGKGTQ
jgi:hypothetical protein